MHPAIPDVDPVRGRSLGYFSEPPEMAEVWFVRPHLLSRHHYVKRNRQLRQRGGEEVIVAIGEDRQPPARRSQRPERVTRVRKYRHLRPRRHKSISGIKRNAKPSRGPRE